MRPSYFVAIDTETTIDASQRLLFGAWRYCRLDWTEDVPALVTLDEGLFFADDLPTFDRDGYEVLRRYVSERWSDTDRTHPEAAWQLRLQDRQDFAEHVIWRAGYEKKAHLVFFNAGFDISRLAVRAADARASRRRGPRPADRRFVGGFSLFVWPPGIWRPWFKIKHLDSKRALKRFGGPKRIDPENLDDSEEAEPQAFAGHILDCRTLAFALTNQGHTLETACDAFDVPYTKRQVQHGRITPGYVDYCREDVEATANLCAALLAEYARHPIELQPTRAYSPASIAKGYLRSMGVSPPTNRLGEVPEGESWDSITGYAMTAYYGGRTETRIRRTRVPVVVLDFTSQYPTVCRLIDAWKFLTADRIDAVDENPAVVQAFVDDLSVDALFDWATWKDLFAICQVAPAGEVLPVRARYDEHGQFGIGVNPYHFDAERLGTTYPWYALPDVIACRLLGDRAPRILRAIRFVPQGTDDRLAPTSLRGMVPVEPRQDDFFQRVVEERERRYRDESLPEGERERLRDFMKVLANSAGYGIYAEMNRTELGKRATEMIDVFGLKRLTQRVRAPEQVGEFFFAPLAATVTGCGRLLLAMLEREVSSRGGTYAVCDTDSAFVVATGDGQTPSSLTEAIPALSWQQIRDIQTRFNHLSPFDPAVVPDLLKAERNSLERELWCYAISAKRYVLYRDAPDRTVIEGHGEQAVDNEEDGGIWDIAKPSQHGLGHLLNPTDPDSASRDWIADGWRWLMALDLGLERYDPGWLDRPAVSQVTISTPGYWHLFDAWNEGKSFAEAVKPFGFMLVTYADPLRSSQEVGRLVHPYERDPERWMANEWTDLYEPGRRYRIGVRRAGDPVRDPGTVYVKTYRDVLNSYLGHPESKSTGPDGEVCKRWTRGRLGRRAIDAAVVMHIGKEANRLEERLTGVVLSEDDFLLRLGDDGSWSRLVVPALRTFDTSEVVAESGVARSTYADIVAGRTKPQKRHERVLRRVAHVLAGDWLKRHGAQRPGDPGARLAIYLKEFSTWTEEVARQYEEALKHLRQLTVDRRGTITRTAQLAGVSRRRLWMLRDAATRERVVEACAVLMNEGE